MWRGFRPSEQYRDSQDTQDSFSVIECLATEKAVSFLPGKERDAIRWAYVFQGSPLRMARELALTKQGLADTVDRARTMLKNQLSD